MAITIQEPDFEAASLLAGLRARTTGRAGAIVTFTGYVRDYSAHEATKTLFLEHYPGMCEAEIGRVAEQAAERFSMIDYEIVHRVGELGSAAQIVFIAVASAHRGDAFKACEFIIDALKTRAPFWKRETLADGRQFWVEQRQSDLDRADVHHPATS